VQNLGTTPEFLPVFNGDPDYSDLDWIGLWYDSSDFPSGVVNYNGDMFSVASHTLLGMIANMAYERAFGEQCIVDFNTVDLPALSSETEYQLRRYWDACLALHLIENITHFEKIGNLPLDAEYFQNYPKYEYDISKDRISTSDGMGMWVPLEKRDMDEFQGSVDCHFIQNQIALEINLKMTRQKKEDNWNQEILELEEECVQRNNFFPILKLSRNIFFERSLDCEMFLESWEILFKVLYRAYRWLEDDQQNQRPKLAYRIKAIFETLKNQNQGQKNILFGEVNAEDGFIM